MGAEVLDRSGINPRDVALFIPHNLKKFKLKLFERIGDHIRKLGGQVVRHDYAAVTRLPDSVIPIVGCTPEFRQTIAHWRREGRTWVYWVRGYLRRVFATHLPTGAQLGIPGGYYRWHLNRPQMGQIYDVPDDRWKRLKLDTHVRPWNRNGRHIVVADTLPDYWNLFSDPDWTARIVAQLKTYTDRPIVVRPKESWTSPLYEELRHAHCLVAHGSIAAIESVVMGCPVFVDEMCAASLVGSTNFNQVETPVYPERMPWLHSLAYCQFTEDELVDGTMWRLIR